MSRWLGQLGLASAASVITLPIPGSRIYTLARVLAITADELLGVVTERTGTDRDRLLAQNEAALSQISDSELEMISVQLRAVAEWRKI